MGASLKRHPVVKQNRAGDPDAVARALEALAKLSGGVLTPDQVLAAARAQTVPCTAISRGTTPRPPGPGDFTRRAS
jgi:hypothetical protein